ncbi:chorismate mutase [Pseudoxanthomonas indica]|uniref:chorismate mutase n=1 Tax=Pseudoxanthomonas indica TaxID=428993 RepID=A0A1T5LP30_9GAMM|nr:chorismate mutase [Pseudoxanthomonas indica]GGD37124.1 hypothetical protein GCM10007235_06570 [Pseudoxanthomonas indica]SKC77309.1 Chorismate mutase [Pseudoxanthomonas indica]
MWLDRLALSGARHAIDHIDDRMVTLFAHRQRLAALAGRVKAHAGLRRQDAQREQRVTERARRQALRCGLDPDAARWQRVLVPRLLTRAIASPEALRSLQAIRGRRRRLTLTGDTELGLLLRNLLERMPWESVPLGLRIALQRGARVVQRARAAHQLRRGVA